MGQEQSKTDVSNAKYTIEVRTGNVYGAGTDADVTMMLIGQDGSGTPWEKLDNLLVDDFEKGQINRFTITTKDVGMPNILRIKLENAGTHDDWFCNNIIVKYKESEAEFPVYDWIEDQQEEVVTGEATLPQNTTNEYLKSQRRQEIQRAQFKFAWCPRVAKGETGWGMPRFMKAATFEEIPKIFRQDDTRTRNRMDARTSAKMNALKQFVHCAFSPIDEISDYHRLYKKIDRTISPPVPHDWQTDEGFGRSALNGVCQVCLYRCHDCLPSGFDVTNDDVSGLLSDGKTLQEEMEAGKIYVSDGSKYLKGISRNKTQDGFQIRCADSIGMFYVNFEKKFVPIAIQLVPGDRDYLFTPANSKEDWMLAKMYYKCTETNVHQWVYHFLYTHGVMEPVAISVFRDLPRCHPIHKLLRPHLKNVVAINTDGRQGLLPADGPINSAIAIPALVLCARVFETFKFDDLVIPKVIEKQGVGDTDLLPGYHYRDDVLKLWKIMQKYVASVINHYYHCDKDVQGDDELQHWTNDIATQGFGWQDSNTRGMPTSIETKETLIEICTTVMFTSTAQHAAVNFGQFDVYKFIPHMPGGMRLPPHKKGEGSMKRILDSLPGHDLSLVYIVFSYVLSTYSENEVYIGNFPERLFTEEAIQIIQAEYKQDLDAFSEEIKKRNRSLEFPYTYLLPERIPNYIAI